jgi:hypothetical protein
MFELTKEQEMQARYTANQGVSDLIMDNPELMDVDTEILVKVYVAGLVAGINVFNNVLNTELR